MHYIAMANLIIRGGTAVCHPAPLPVPLVYYLATYELASYVTTHSQVNLDNN